MFFFWGGGNLHSCCGNIFVTCDKCRTPTNENKDKSCNLDNDVCVMISTACWSYVKTKQRSCSDLTKRLLSKQTNKSLTGTDCCRLPNPKRRGLLDIRYVNSLRFVPDILWFPSSPGNWFAHFRCFWSAWLANPVSRYFCIVGSSWQNSIMHQMKDFQYAMRSLQQIVALLPWRSSVCPFVCPFWDGRAFWSYMVHVSANLSLSLDSPIGHPDTKACAVAIWRSVCFPATLNHFSSSTWKRMGMDVQTIAWYLENGWR